MNVMKVAAMPIDKLKNDYLVLIFESLSDFHSVTTDGPDPVFYDDQKAYCIRGRNAFVLFHGGKKDFFRWADQFSSPTHTHSSVDKEVQND